MDNLDKTISIFDIASDSNESGPKGLIKKFWPEWQPIEELGRGSYGTVFKCARKENNIESKAAIKIISIPQNKSEIEDLYSEGMTNEDVSTYYNNIVTDFGNEISLMEQLKGHPNIVGIEDYKIKMQDNKIGWDILIRMELLSTFSSYIKNNTLTEEDIIKLGTDILTALEVCEKKNIVHRDIKPENIFVNDFGNFKLGDFGIAKRFESLGASHSQKGTFNYMAPEVASGTHYDSTVDIYSLGLVLYRLANNNCLPFLTPENKTSPTARKDALEKRLSGEKIPAPNCQNEALATAILKALEFNPNDRYKTAAEFKEALINAEKGVPVPMAAATAVATPIVSESIDDLEKTGKISGLAPNETFDEEDEKKKRHLWVPLLCIILALFVGVGVFAFLRNKKNQPDSPVIKVSPTVTAKQTATPSPRITAKPTATPTAKPSSGGSYYTRSGSYITFGSYPQSEVTDSSLKSILTSAAGSTSNWTSYDYEYIVTEEGDSHITDFMKYKDVTYGGQKYRGVCFTEYRHSWERDNVKYSYQLLNGYFVNNVYWFKYEPIKWKILFEKNGVAFLLAETCLDAHEFNKYGKDYANSSIRHWLNDTFFNTAFSGLEQSKIETTRVDNSAATTDDINNKNVCEDTYDKIFLLSYKDITNVEYGFSSSDGEDKNRMRHPTQYAQSQAAYVCSNGAEGYWWLRSIASFAPDYYGVALYSGVGGEINHGNGLCGGLDMSVVPALHLML